MEDRRTNAMQERKATVKNQRLAMQMANRPSVQAALKLKKVNIMQNDFLIGKIAVEQC